MFAPVAQVGDDVGDARVDEQLLEPATGRDDEQDAGDAGQAGAERLVGPAPDASRRPCRA
jgi:hypothetical protein